MAKKQFKAESKRLLELMKQNDKLSLNQYCRRARIPYPAAVRLLAKFIRYGIVETVFEDRQFHYKLKE